MLLLKLLVRKMSEFISRRNARTGETEWVTLPRNYDYNNEIARAAYADMLHDTDRNEKYYIGIRHAIEETHKENKPAIVLDIGTGTGLLSMMAKRAGADHVYACEGFGPMLSCAEKVISRNGFSASDIVLIGKRSTEMKVGIDIPNKCNILVTELFDTELIGEGAISSYNHARLNLMTAEYRSVPLSAQTYLQQARCPFIKASHILFGSEWEESMTRCNGVPSVHDLQLSNLTDFELLTPPIPAFKFNFTETLPEKREMKFNIEKDADTAFFFWTLDMDGHNTTISCRPTLKQGPNSNDNGNTQSAHVKLESAHVKLESADVKLESADVKLESAHVKLESADVKLESADVKLESADVKLESADGSSIELGTWRDHWMQSAYYLPPGTASLFNHDEYSFWFGSSSSHPACTCAVHTRISRSRIHSLNTINHAPLIVKHLPQSSNDRIVCIGDDSLLPLQLQKLLPQKKIVILGNNSLVSMETIQQVGENDILVADPYFNTSINQWDNILLFYRAGAKKIINNKVVIMATAAQFKHLWKINAPVHTTCGFKLADFDQLIMPRVNVDKMSLDAQPLWEYDYVTRSRSTSILTLAQPLSSVSSSGVIETDGLVNGLIINAKFYIEDEVMATDPFQSQDIYFFKTDKKCINYEISFNQNSGNFDLKFY